jgi:hypothetical protein
LVLAFNHELCRHTDDITTLKVPPIAELDPRVAAGVMFRPVEADQTELEGPFIANGCYMPWVLMVPLSQREQVVAAQQLTPAQGNRLNDAAAKYKVRSTLNPNPKRVTVITVTTTLTLT